MHIVVWYINQMQELSDSAGYNIKWLQHITNDNLYGSLKRVGDEVASQRMVLAGHLSS